MVCGNYYQPFQTSFKCIAFPCEGCLRLLSPAFSCTKNGFFVHNTTIERIETYKWWKAKSMHRMIMYWEERINVGHVIVGGRNNLVLTYIHWSF